MPPCPIRRSRAYRPANRSSIRPLRSPRSVGWLPSAARGEKVARIRGRRGSLPGWARHDRGNANSGEAAIQRRNSPNVASDLGSIRHAFADVDELGALSPFQRLTIADLLEDLGHGRQGRAVLRDARNRPPDLGRADRMSAQELHPAEPDPGVLIV